MARRSTRTIFFAALLASACARHEPPGAFEADADADAERARGASGREATGAAHRAGPEGSASAPRPAWSVATLAGAAPEGGGAGGAKGALPEHGPTELPIGDAYEVDASSPTRVFAVARPAWVFEGPDHASRRAGYVQPGMTLPRAAQPVGRTRRCRGGWYRVAPRGFVCMNGDWTEDSSHPVVLALAGREAKRGAPLPYRYGRVRGYAPFLYARVPTPREQRTTEGAKLDEHLAHVGKPLHLVGPVEPVPAWMQPLRSLPKPLNAPHRAQRGPHRGQGGPKSSYAFVSVLDVGPRLFGLTTDLDLVPVDRVRLAVESPFHGGPIDDLPAALAPRGGAARFGRDDKGRLTGPSPIEPFDAVSLTGQVRDDLLEVRSGGWVPQRGLHVVKARTSFPAWVKEGDASKWVDISIQDQTLVAYEGKRAVFVTRVSTGAGFDGDPETTTATVRGYFKIQAKHVTATMTGAQSEEDYELSDVPYVQYFQGGYALHAAFWHEDFGRPRSHGCVNLSPRDAAWLFEWTEPQVPAAWHGVEANGEGTLVYIH